MFGWIKEVFHYREFLKNLILKDFKVRYQGSVLGFLWTLITPLATIGIYLVALKYIMNIQVPNFSLFLITGILPWTFFSTAAIMSTDAVVGNGQLVKKIRFPREALPLSVVLFNFAHLLLALLVFFPVMLWLGGRITPALLVLPLIFIIHMALTTGLALFLSAATVFYRDIRPVTDLGMMALFWMTPILYDISLVPARFRLLWEWFPATAIIRAYQDCLYRGVFPSLEIWTGAVVWALAALIAGSMLFVMTRDRFPEEL